MHLLLLLLVLHELGALHRRAGTLCGLLSRLLFAYFEAEAFFAASAVFLSLLEVAAASKTFLQA